MKCLHIRGDDFGVIYGRKNVDDVRIWLTAKSDDTWWVVIAGPDHEVRTMGFVRPPQEKRARETYDDLSKPGVLQALLDGRDS